MKIEITGDRKMLKFSNKYKVKIIVETNTVRVIDVNDEGTVYATYDRDFNEVWFKEGLKLGFVKGFIELVSDK